MIAPDERVTAYIAAAPQERKPGLEPLRGLCRERVADVEEDLRYGLP